MHDPVNPADFSPNLNAWADMGPFRFWCQKVLPLVYDDSMSYYELLCKVVQYLNTTITNVNALGGNVDLLKTAYDQLEGYVNTYFDNLDVQYEINQKLNAMAADGTLQEILNPRVQTYVSMWLGDYLGENPSSPVVDKSLTLANAAAESQAVGLRMAGITDDTDNFFKPNFLTRAISGSASMTNNGTAIEFTGTTAAGTDGQGGATIISEPMSLAAGDYKLGVFGSVLPNTKLNIKLRVLNNDGTAGSDVSDGGTSSSKTVTIDQDGTYCVQLRYFGSQDLSGITAYIYVVAGTSAPSEYVPGISARDYIARDSDAATLAALNNYKTQIANGLTWKTGELIADGTDLNTVATPGLYRGSAASTYTHAPLVDGNYTAAGGSMTGANFILEVIGQTTSAVIIQMLKIIKISTEAQVYQVYYRTRTGTAANPSWGNWQRGYDRRELDDLTRAIKTGANIETGTDLDEVTQPGLARGSASSKYINGPTAFNNTTFTPDGGSETAAMTGKNFILQVIGQTTSTVLIQIMQVINIGGDGNTYKLYYRTRTGAGTAGSPYTWGTWYKGIDRSDIDAVENIYKETFPGPASTPYNLSYTYANNPISADPVIPLGWMRGGSGRTYGNCPKELINTSYTETHVDASTGTETTETVYAMTGYNILLLTLGENGSNTVYWQFLFLVDVGSGTPFAMYQRMRAGSPAAWKDWICCSGEQLDNYTSGSFTASATSSADTYSGQRVRLMQYNVAQWNNNSNNYFTNARILAFRKLLMDKEPDFVTCQEEATYIDSASSKTPMSYLFRPTYPASYGGDSCYVHSRGDSSVTTNNRLWLNAGEGSKHGRIGYGLYTVGSKTLLVVSVHAFADIDDSGSDSQTNIDNRLAEYEDLFAWLRGEGTLNNGLHGGGDDISVPTYDAAIVAGDFNTITATDRTNLQTQAAGDGTQDVFTLANGGYLGWLATQHNKNGEKPLDNVAFIGCRLAGLKVMKGRAQSLHSDHYPVVIDLIVED